MADRMSAATIGTTSRPCLDTTVVPRLSAAPPSCLACCRRPHIASILLSTNPTSLCCTMLDKGMKMYCITIPDPGKQNASVRTSMLRPVLESSLTIQMLQITRSFVPKTTITDNGIRLSTSTVEKDMPPDISPTPCVACPLNCSVRLLATLRTILVCAVEDLLLQPSFVPLHHVHNSPHPPCCTVSKCANMQVAAA